MERSVPAESIHFHTRIGIAYAIFGTFAVVGSRLSSIVVQGGGMLMIVLLLCIAIFCPLPAYWHQKHRSDKREAALAPLWVLPFGLTLPFVVSICGRSAMPLQDLHFARLDQLMGVNVPLIAAWASQHQIGRAIDSTYPMLIPFFVPLAIFAPALLGRWMAAREFVVANILALLLGLTLFTILPAVGPWYGYHLAPSSIQQFCQTELLHLRVPGPLVTHPAGIVCFPSFHVIWAILCARTLWTFRFFRIPVAVFAGLIILSTLTTGWHYFIDVLGGFAISYVSILIAAQVIRNQALTFQAINPPEVSLTPGATLVPIC